MTAAEVRIPRARLIVALVGLAGCAAILLLARGYTFYFDEWTFILSAPDWNASTYLQSHNGHPAMLPRLIYSALFSTVGLRAYLPYMVVLLALHAASVLFLFELVRRRAGDLIGLGFAAILLVLGAGWENLLWAFQMSFVGSVAFGLAMLLALDAPPSRRRMPLVVAMLAGSLMFSGVGLVFGIAAAVTLAATRDRRKELVWLVPVAIVFAAWFIAYGRTGATPDSSSTASNLVVLPLYTLWGLGASAAGLIGEGGMFGPPLLVLAVGAVAFAWWRRSFEPRALGVAAGLVAFYLVIGLSRAELGYQQSGAGRYVYVGGVFWLLLLADAAARLPWRGTWRPATAACIFLAFFSSATLLFTFAVAKEVQMERELADLQALAAERGDPCLNPTGSVDPLVMPSVTEPALYYRAVDRYGDPAASTQVVDKSSFEQARANLQIPGCK
jgi:hypothetical protein